MAKSEKLVPKPADDIEDQRKHDAEQDAGGQRKIEGSVLSAIDDVSWKTPERNIGSAKENRRSCHKNNSAENH